MTDRRIVLVAHNVRSLWNVGSFFRTADAFSIEHVYLTGYTPTPPRKEITKTAIGAEAWIPWTHFKDPLDVISLLHQQLFTVISLEITQNSIDVSGIVLSPDAPVCIIVGNEILGVPDDVLKKSDLVASIPMLWEEAFLNVSVAAGIALHRFRQS